MSSRKLSFIDTFRGEDTTKRIAQNATTDALTQLSRLADDLLPAVRDYSVDIADATGMSRATTLSQWCEQLEVLDGVRESLDVFVPEVFERSAADMVIATASRPESVDWVKRMGAHHVIDHSRPLAPQVSALGIGAPAFVFCTNGIDRYLPDITELIAPQGRIAMIDDPETLDIVPLKRKSLTISWEFMFTRSLLGTADIARQGEILRELGDLVSQGKVRSTRTETLGRINAQNLRRAHERLEGGRTLGKLVLAGW